MHIVFVSNFFNHHQEELSREFDLQTSHQYSFIATMPMSQERKAMGWESGSLPSYVIESFKPGFSADRLQQMLLEADVVIWGSVPWQLLKERIRKGLLTFWYSERLYKVPCPRHRLLQKAITMHCKFGKYKNLHLLCASAYTSADFARTHTLSGRRYKWGYFPPAKKYSGIEQLISEKESFSILWTARMIDWKHPEIPLRIARLLKDRGCLFHMTLIGNGELQESVFSFIQENHLENQVSIIDSMSPKEVRKKMENSSIFLVTSDRNEGWGAVVNEAMNSGCAVIASHAAGSVPFLIQDGVNGLIYQSGNLDELFQKTCWLLEHIDFCQQLGKAAYNTITQQWNAKNAVSRLLVLSQRLLEGNTTPFADGVCSEAEIIEDNWYVDQNSLSRSLS